MTCPCIIHLPFPISTNGLYRNVAKKGRVKTKKYRTWEKEAGWAITEQKPGHVEGNYELQIDLQRSRTIDLDNAVKCISDILVRHGIVQDDSKMERLEVMRSRYVTGARVAVIPERPIPDDAHLHDSIMAGAA